MLERCPPRREDRVVEINARYCDLASMLHERDPYSTMPALKLIVYRVGDFVIEIDGKHATSEMRVSKGADVDSILRELSEITGTEVHLA
ncbi:MAG: hypothetical protein HY517_02575 [Candidatus Aenigmarchaeota archaeon]|nr:hypothetical protein [Candidatus Aenigmarchaeota archaeon]